MKFLNYVLEKMKFLNYVLEQMKFFNSCDFWACSMGISFQKRSSAEDMSKHNRNLYLVSFYLILRSMDKYENQSQGNMKGQYLKLNAHYTPGIYADGYIVFAFPFVRSSVRMFVSSFVRTSVTFVEFASKFCVKVSHVVYISATTHQKAFIFGP